MVKQFVTVMVNVILLQVLVSVILPIEVEIALVNIILKNQSDLGLTLFLHLIFQQDIFWLIHFGTSDL